VELILFLPLVISLIAFFLPSKIVKEFSLAFSAVFFLLSLSLIAQFNPHIGFNFTSYSDKILSEIGGSFFLGLDGIGLLMVLLTNFVVLYVNLMAWSKKYSSSFYGLVFLMQFALIGVFSSYNAILFYFFWELALIPIYFIVFKWGTGVETKQTFTRFFIYTFVGSLLILAAFILFYSQTGISSFELKFMIPKSLEGNAQIIFTVLLFVGFGVKIPIFPLHSWQADTYRKAPAEGTILLSGIMLKMGLYGVYRWLVPFQENANPHIQSIVLILCIVGILYGAFIALRRNDLKLVAAFSSLSHVGLIAAGIFAYKYTGFQGSVLQMVVHGVNIVGLFYIIDLIERSTGTRDISELGGVASKSPVFATLAFIIVLGSIAVPLTNGFPGEMLLLFSIFIENKIMGIVAGLTIILGAAYMLRVFQRVFMGEVSAKVEEFKTIETIHLIALGFICILVLAIGIYPQFILDLTAEGSQYLTNLLEIKNN
jgi:NADH-quinone oxidoreductase subunit M